MTDLVKQAPEEVFLTSLPEKYTTMVEVIKAGYPEIKRATNLFQKSQSQLMDNLLTVTALTPIRNLRQILAEMKRSRQALGEAFFKCQKLKIKIRKKEADLPNKTGLDLELLETEIDEHKWQLECIYEGVSGAIRKLTHYTKQYEAIMEAHGLKGFDEGDFEREEEAYHISRACQQALTAARSHGGTIDEGNMIYFQQLGINCGVMQRELYSYLTWENNKMAKGEEPTHMDEVEFIFRMIDKFKGCTKAFLRYRGQLVDPIECALER